MMVLKTKSNLGSYNSYLHYKHVIDVLRKDDFTVKEVAARLEMLEPQVSHIMRVLLNHRVVKRVRYDLTGYNKRAVYRLIKDE